MSEYPNYTLEQLAQLILKLDMKEGVSPAGLGALQMFAKSALENASQQSFALDGATCPTHGLKLVDGYCPSLTCVYSPPRK